MTAIAWAIVFVGLIFLDFKFSEYHQTKTYPYCDALGWIILSSISILMFCTVRELMR